MPGVTSNEQIVREDMSNIYLNLDVRKTPVQTRMKRGENLRNVTLYSWPVEKYDGRQVVGVPENKDADSFESNKQKRLYNRSQKFWRQPHVTVEANEVNVAPADFGKMNKEIKNKTREQQRDVETRILADNESRDDDGIIGREIKGMGRVINDGVSVGSSGAALPFSDTQTSIDPEYQTPTAQIYTGYLTTIQGTDVTTISPVGGLTEEVFLDMVSNRFDAVGMTTELAMFCDVALKRHISRYFGKYKANVRGYTTIVRTPDQAVESKSFAQYGVDLLETDFGPIDINLVSFMPRRSDGTFSGRGYLLDMDNIRLRPSGLWMTYRDLEDKGAGPRGLIQSILGWEYGDPRGHCKIDPVGLQQTVGS